MEVDYIVLAAIGGIVFVCDIMSDKLKKLALDIIIILLRHSLFGLVDILVYLNSRSLCKLVCDICVSCLVIINHACAHYVCRGKTCNRCESRIYKSNVIIKRKLANNLSEPAAFNSSLYKIAPLGDISSAHSVLVFVIIGANKVSVLALAYLLRNTLTDKELYLVGHGMIGNCEGGCGVALCPLNPEITGSRCAVCKKKAAIGYVLGNMLHKGNGSKLNLKGKAAVGKALYAHLLRDLTGELSCHLVNKGLRILTRKECGRGRGGTNVYFNKTILAIYASADNSGFNLDGNGGSKFKGKLLAADICVRDKVGKLVRSNRPGNPMDDLLVLKNNCHRIVEHSVKQKLICKVILVHLDTKHFFTVDRAEGGNEISLYAFGKFLGNGIAYNLVVE